MLTRLHLTNFKNFADATLELGPFTVLVGTNASGKSNVRDALRFLHGIGRGYSFAEIVGRKYSEVGELQWNGVRGGAREVARIGCDNFGIGLGIRIISPSGSDKNVISTNYSVCVSAAGVDGSHLLSEHLAANGKSGKDLVYDASEISLRREGVKLGEFLWPNYSHKVKMSGAVDLRLPLLTQFVADNISVSDPAGWCFVGSVAENLRSIRFLDPEPELMRRPAFPGAIHLGDRGENLSAVLLDICRDPAQKQTLMAWLAELTPMDVVDFEFPSDLTGAVLAVLVERSGLKVSAYSASDGTLRFLAILAALLGRERGRCYFIEELDNGLHPARLHLLVELIERQTAAGHVQVIASTHSPQLLDLLSPASREHASLVYRLPDSDDARITRIVDLPNVKDVLQSDSLAELHASGWLENAAAFGADPEPS